MDCTFGGDGTGLPPIEEVEVCLDFDDIAFREARTHVFLGVEPRNR